MLRIRYVQSLALMVAVLFVSLALANEHDSPEVSHGHDVVDAPNGIQIVVSGDEGARSFQQQWGYAPAIRAGDWIVVSGVIAGPAPGEGTDAEAFKAGLRRTFEALSKYLAALDASLADVVKLNTYHVFDSAFFDGDKFEHMEAVRAVKVEMMGEASPVWSAIGVSELFSDSGLVEIELTVYAPQSESEQAEID